GRRRWRAVAMVHAAARARDRAARRSRRPAPADAHQVQDPLMTTIPQKIGAGEDVRARTITTLHSPKDRVFRGVTRGAATCVLLIMVLVGTFLTAHALRAIKSVGVWKFLTTQAWSPETNNFGIAAVMTGTILIALVALSVSVPLSMGTALFTSEI